MGARLNAILLVVDSLRAGSLRGAAAEAPRTPFLDELATKTVCFRWAYATECWTLPTHLSMFTGLLPSEHGAHFQSMEYMGSAPTIAELFARAGYHTEVVTRNSLFDGTVPGATRGFRRNTRLLAEAGPGCNPLPLLLALAKPRLRRVMRRSGFFHLLQRESRSFLTTLVRMGIPADRRVLEYALEQMARLRRQGTPYFLFLNLYDVHAPYSPSPDSPLRSLRTPRGLIENLLLPSVLPRISSHAYLRPGFRLSGYSRRMLLSRYHRAIELMDGKLADFYLAARSAGLLDDTLLVVTSDHGEGFGEHGLYLHDASLHETHLHVPLWVHHPERAPAVVDDVVSTRELFPLLRAVGAGSTLEGTLLDAGARTRDGVAVAEHFHYPYTEGLLPRYTKNIAAAIVGRRKLIVRGDVLEHYDLARDPDEGAPGDGGIMDFETACRRDGASRGAIAAAVNHLRRWGAQAAAAWRQ